MRTMMLTAALLAPLPLMAQASEREPSISVAGVGEVKTPPDVAMVSYDIAGEGRTADEASRDLATRHKALVNALTALLGRESEATSGQVSVTQTRARECQGGGNYYGQAQLSEGACAVTGYVVSLSGQVRSGAVEKAATAVGLAARLGARNARIQGFELLDPRAAQRRATVAALVDAKRRAQTAAEGAGVRLGELLSISDQGGGGADIVLTAQRAEEPPAPAPPPPPPPVAIDIKPQPIESQARVYVRYAIAR